MGQGRQGRALTAALAIGVTLGPSIGWATPPGDGQADAQQPCGSAPLRQAEREARLWREPLRAGMPPLGTAAADEALEAAAQRMHEARERLAEARDAREAPRETRVQTRVQTRVETRDGARAETRVEVQGRTSRGHVVLRQPRGYLGITTSAVSETRWSADGRMVRYCSYPMVVSIEPGSPAERAGLAAGDTVLAYAGRDLLADGPIPLDRLLEPGKPLRVKLRRGGRTVERKLVVGERPSVVAFRTWVGPEAGAFTHVPLPPAPPPAARLRVRTPRPPTDPAQPAQEMVVLERLAPALAPPAPPAPAAPPAPPTLTVRPLIPALVTGGMGPLALAGAQLVALDDDLRGVLDVSPTVSGGVLVLKVLPDTPAADAGLRAGDVIASAGGRAVATPRALQRALVEGRDGRTLVLRVDRKGQGREVVLRW